jgi:hypothetical protein
MMTAHPSLAGLLDEIRPLIAAARLTGNPRYVLLSPATFDLIAGYRARDRSMGLPVTVLGLEAVRADEPDTAPRVF